ncbi:hypothetical protein GcC1_053039, partial [Golovinomyces cichoracearum]
PPICDIDGFADSDSCDQKHVGFHTNAVDLYVPDVPLYDIPSSRNDSVGKEPEKENNLAELQQEGDQLEANLAEARKDKEWIEETEEMFWMMILLMKIHTPQDQDLLAKKMSI